MTFCKSLFLKFSLLLVVLLLSGCMGNSEKTQGVTSDNSNVQSGNNNDTAVNKEPQIKTPIGRKNQYSDNNVVEKSDSRNESNQNNKNTNKFKNENKDTSNLEKDRRVHKKEKEEVKTEENSTTKETDSPSEIKINTSQKNQKEAIALVRTYLKKNNKKYIEDQDHFLEYDGEIRGYVIVRYSTLISGHSSTNGRYAVDLNNDEIKDVTSKPEFFN